MVASEVVYTSEGSDHERRTDGHRIPGRQRADTGYRRSGRGCSGCRGRLGRGDRLDDRGGGTIKIDIEQAPSVIAEIDKAILAVKKITRSMGHTNWLEPPGLDDYSGYAVSGISDADQRHNDASSKYLQILTETREKLQQSFDAYKRGDSVASDGITKSGTLL